MRGLCAAALGWSGLLLKPCWYVKLTSIIWGKVFDLKRHFLLSDFVSFMRTHKQEYSNLFTLFSGESLYWVSMMSVDKQAWMAAIWDMLQTHCSVIYRMALILMPCSKSGLLGIHFLIGGFVPYGFFIAYLQVSTCYFNHETIIRWLSCTALSLKCNGIQVMKWILIFFAYFAWHSIFTDDGTLEGDCSQGYGELMVDSSHHFIQSLCC